MIDWLPDGLPNQLRVNKGLKSSCGRFKIRYRGGEGWILWETRYRNSRPVGTVSSTLEGCFVMAEKRIKEEKE